MKKILLFCNGSLGIRLVRYIVNQPDLNVTAIVVNDEIKRTPFLVRELELAAKEVEVFSYTDLLWEDIEFRKAMMAADLAVSALFGYLIPSNVIEHFGANIFNLHPSFLPIGRGADPVAWSIINSQKQGATIHALTKELDKGSIILQSEISVDINMSSGEVYGLAIDELFNLFKQLLADWPEQLRPIAQEGFSSYHKSIELVNLREALMAGNHELESTIRVIQALTYSDERKARVRFQDGTLWDVSLSLKQVD